MNLDLQGANTTRERLFKLEAFFHELGLDSKEKQLAFVEALPKDQLPSDVRSLIHLYFMQGTTAKIASMLAEKAKETSDPALEEIYSRYARAHGYKPPEPVH